MSKISSPLAIGGIIFILLGTIMTIAGIISLIANRANPSVWYVWFLIISGLVLGIAGGIMLAVALATVPKTEEEYSYEIIPSNLQNGNTAPGVATTIATNKIYPQYFTNNNSPNIHITRTATEGNSVVSTTLNTSSFGSPTLLSST